MYETQMFAQSDPRMHADEALDNVPTKGCQLEPHIDIDQAVSDLDYVIMGLESMLCRITGKDHPGAEAAGTSYTPPMIEVLQRSPGMIRDKNQRMSELIRQINNALFGDD